MSKLAYLSDQQCPKCGYDLFINGAETLYSCANYCFEGEVPYSKIEKMISKKLFHQNIKRHPIAWGVSYEDDPEEYEKAEQQYLDNEEARATGN